MPITEVRPLIESTKISEGRDGIQIQYVYLVDTPILEEILNYNDGDPAHYIPKYGDVLSDDFRLAYPNAQYYKLSVSDVSIESFEQFSKVYVTYSQMFFDPRANEHNEVWEYNWATSQDHITSVERVADEITLPPALDVGNTTIGQDGDTIHGTDVYRPQLSVRVTKRVARANWSTGDQQQLLRCVGCVNNNSWPVNTLFAAREVLFQGAIVRPLVAGVFWEIEYNFLVAQKQDPRLVDLYQGGTITIAPNPWDHVDFHFAERMPLPGNTFVPESKVKSAQIFTVYPSEGFGLLNLYGD